MTRPVLAAVLLVLVFCQQSLAQQSCPAIRAIAPDASQLLFNPQQEMYLGEVIADQIQSQFLVVDEDQVTTYLRRVGERVARQLPDTSVQYQFFLYDQPQIQAFEIPGGRIYVSRKMVAYLHSEDELAGVLGHELGHLVARQGNIHMSQGMRDVLGVRSLGDREDVFEKYNEFMESVRLKKWRGGSNVESEQNQIAADRIGMEATARAGYSPQAFVDLLDRRMQTKGKTGNWFTDFFGSTRPEGKRLKETLKDLAIVPAACADSRPVGTPDEFRAWQQAVLHYQGIGHVEGLHDVIYRKNLNAPLREDIEHFRFSPDGKYILAQDSGGVAVLTREPLALKFRFDTVRAEGAQFSPDSRQIVFSTRDLRVESWDVEKEERISLSDLPIIHGCLQRALSPDGKFLACLGPQYDLGLYDVQAGQEIFHKDRFFEYANNPFGFLFVLGRLVTGEGIANLRFSPDSVYFAASAPGAGPIVLQLPEGTKVNIPGDVRAPLESSFTFLGPDRLIGVDRNEPQKSPIVHFPNGGVIDHLPLGGGNLTAATNPRYVLVRPYQNHPVAAYDLETKKIAFSARNSATDVCGDVFVSERLNGEVGIYKVGETKPFASVQLPLGKLGWLRTAAVSPDLRWLATSLKTRGAIWDLQGNERILFTRGFQEVFSVSPEIFYLLYPKFEEAQPELVAFSSANRKSAERILEKDEELILLGKTTLRKKHAEKEHDPRRNITLEMLGTEKGEVLWSKTFPKHAPGILGQNSLNRVILSWRANTDGAKFELESNPDLQGKPSLKGIADSDELLEVIDDQTGKLLTAIVHSTGNHTFEIRAADSAGDNLVLSEALNRVAVYSIATGKVRARFFGSAAVLSSNGERLCLSNERGQLHVYDLSTLRQLDEFAFASRIAMKSFSIDGQKLLVLTDDQNVTLLDLSKAPDSRTAAVAEDH
jgi:WD40 repeat protein